MVIVLHSQQYKLILETYKMAEQIITQTAIAEFNLHWQGVNNSNLHLNFNPIISQYNLTKLNLRQCQQQLYCYVQH